MAVKKIVIVGGVAGGASAAARARRLNDAVDIIILERGPYVSFANCGLPYHLGGDIAERGALLLHTPKTLKERFGLDARVNSEAIAIDRAAKTVTVRDHAQGRDYTETYDALILAPGAKPIRPPLPGLDDARVFTLRNIPDLDRLMAALTPAVRRVSVVGGGYIGLETLEALKHRGLAVTLIERAPQIMTPLDVEMTAPLLGVLKQQGVTLHLGDEVATIAPGESLTLTLGSGTTIEADLVVLAIGVQPDSQLVVDAGLELGIGKSIVVDAHQRTSDASIYAVGDAVEVRHIVGGRRVLLPLAGPANRQGRIAADAIMGRTASYRGSQGSAICRVFSQTAGATGLNEKTLKEMGQPYHRIYLHAKDHAEYYPGAEPIFLKVLFAPDGKILGAQAVGPKGVDKRLDVLATAIQAGMTVDDLAEMELCYAPPYGSAKDPVNMAGMAGQNILAGLLASIEPEAVAAAVAKGAVLVDAREDVEVAAGMIPGAVHIPLSQLRTRAAAELPTDKPIVVYCQSGLRSYIAQRFLVQNGWTAHSMNGGYRTWSMMRAAGMLD